VQHRSVRSCRRTWFTVRLVGEGPARASLEALSAPLGERIAFAGWCPDAPAMMRAADVVCLPSRWETFPYAALEGMCEGRAIVASAVDGLKALADYGEKNKIVINLENDNRTTEDPYHVLKILETANTPYLRALPDFCNSRQLGDEQYNERALEALFPHAFNISHVKDMETVRGETLRTDIAKIFAIAKKAGYRGYFSMEWDAVNGDPYEVSKQIKEKAEAVLHKAKVG